MEDRFIEEDVRSRLIVAGANELSLHGVKDFSLRRVAIAAQVSCAAPYRHFKDKEELIFAVVSQMREDWELLAGQICEAFDDCEKLLIELCIAELRFWNGGEKFKSIFVSGISESELLKFDSPIVEAVKKCGEYLSASHEQTEQMIYNIRLILYGNITLICLGELRINECIDNIRMKIAQELQNLKIG